MATMLLTGMTASAWRLSGIEAMTGIHFLIPGLLFSFLIMFILNKKSEVTS
jgi:hypothetical protein